MKTIKIEIDTDSDEYCGKCDRWQKIFAPICMEFDKDLAVPMD